MTYPYTAVLLFLALFILTCLGRFNPITGAVFRRTMYGHFAVVMSVRCG